METRGKLKTVGDVAENRRCLTFLPEQYVSVILPPMRRNGAAAAGVVDEEGSLLGLLTERDILRRVFRMATDPHINPANLGKHIEDLTVAEAMIPQPEFLHDDLGIEEALEIMGTKGYRFMPVVSRADSGYLIGIADERDLALLVRDRLREVEKSEAQTRSLLSYLLHEPYGTGFQPQSA